jgi:rare lipoprotein A
MMRARTLVLLATLALLLSACAGAPGKPRGGGMGGSDGVKIGRPYQVNGVWYYPRDVTSYRARGVASWYGEDFHGKPTANGEVFDLNLLTAAHTTLPLPSWVRVTNLANGRSVVVRVNDRGPFVDGRLIDLSQRAARDLGFERRGIERVEVEFLGKAIGQYAHRYPGAEPAWAVASARPVTVPSAGPIRVAEAPGEKRPVIAARSAMQGLYVQAAAFADPANAETAASRLRRLGRTRIAAAEVNGRPFYRVWLGPVATHEEAAVLLTQLHGVGHRDARVINPRG